MVDPPIGSSEIEKSRVGGLDLLRALNHGMKYPENYGQFTQMCVDRFLTWQLGLWEESQRRAPVKFVPVYEDQRAKISKLRCLNRRVSRGIGSSHYRTPLMYRRSRTPAASGYRRSYRSRAPFKTQYVRRRYVQNIPRFIKKTKMGVRKLQLYDEQLRDVKFDNKGVARLLNGIELGNKRSDRQSDKIVVKGIKFIGNVQLGQDAKDEAVVHHVLFFVIGDNSPSDSVPTPDKIFIGVGEGNPETWIVDPDQSDRFRMLKKMRFKLVGGKDKEYVRHGIEVVDRFFPVDVWIDYKDTLLGNVGSIQKGAIYLVAATVSGKECKITLRSQMYFKTI
ncbi:hypothetical protein HYC85_029779 [Camellia sinensis]|uniref:Capsid protein n=1 Tax=Camellia sinensis TaxID=4442 RepID=A0A7J7G1H6_CAMSI|nr:hypothetical protein HYC85_029779 [Camellia sinensis]